jgi:hypothetical protein
MTTTLDCDRAPTRGTQIGFYATSNIFNICLIAQLLIAYLLIVSPTTQSTHPI